LDVGGTNARALAVDGRRVLGRADASSAGDGPTLVATLSGLIGDLRATHGEADAVGLGIAGLITDDGTVRHSPNLPGLVEFAVGPALAAAVGVPVACGNDATTGAWAEARLGAGRGHDHFAFVALGTGIGAGLVVDGRLITGAHGFAGEAGHMVVNAHGPTHLTGQPGPWEYFASGNALGRMARQAAADGRFAASVAAAGSVEAVTGHHVTEALHDGDPDALAILDDFCREVARGVANLVELLDLSLVVLGGGLADIGEPLRAGTDRWLGRLLRAADHRPAVEIRLAELGPDAGALGAALLAADRPG
jgi:glucokinase